MLTDNGSCYRSRQWREQLTAAGIVHKRTRPYRPQTNGKVERLNRTLLTEWAYARVFTSGQQRTAALPQWLHTYNHHRAHTALGGRAPISRVNNLPGHYSECTKPTSTTAATTRPRHPASTSPCEDCPWSPTSACWS